MLNHQHIYSTLRSALVDRERDLTITQEQAVIVNIGGNQFALKQAVPSGALLVAYTMLFRPGFMQTASESPQWFANGHYWLGGDNNPIFPIFVNDTVASIAIAVGVYAGFLQAMITEAGVHLRPRFETPIVKRTLELMQSDQLGLTDAKELFITLMQDEQYKVEIPVADDYIANPFIAEFDLGVETSLEQARKAAQEIE